MNCKGNEFAIIVTSLVPSEQELIGKIVFIKDHIGDSVWELEEPLITKAGRRYYAAWDYCLRPIKNPGDEEVDESLTWKCGKPPKIDVKSKETADANG